MRLGVHWAGDSGTCALRHRSTPRSSLRRSAHSSRRRSRPRPAAGRWICAGIHISDIPAFPYELLWGERVLRSVANLTRADGEAFMALAATIPLVVHAEPFPLADANAALAKLRSGALAGAAVLTPGG